MARLIATILLLLLPVSAALAEKRVALVIGNARYVNTTELKNPVNDANDLAAKLEGLGFEVIRATDLDHEAMRRTVKDFADRLDSADVALFYYAGHAVQVNGQNYLAPIDTDLQKESDLDFETVSLSLVQRQMEREARTLLIFLDACRNNPLTRQLARRSRSVAEAQGLARLDLSGEGTFIAYATQPDNVALDGAGRNSPFAVALLENIDRPGIEISALMTDVRRAVYDATDGHQLPWTNSSLLGHFYFKAPGEEPASPSVTDPADQERLDRLARLEAEAAAWESVKDSDDTAKIRAVLAQLGEGPYAELARARLQLLDQAEAEAGADDDGKPEEMVASVAPQAAEPTAAPAIAAVEAEPDRELVRSIQRQLQRLGCDPGGADGLWGSRSRAALGAFSREAKIDLASLEPSATLLDEISKRQGRVCPPICRSGQVEKDGRCVAASPVTKTPPAATAPSKPRQSASAARRSNTVAKRPSGSNCFRFNGELVCE